MSRPSVRLAAAEAFSGQHVSGPARLLACFLFVFPLLLVLLPASARAEGELVTALKNRDSFLSSNEKMAQRSEWLKLIKEFEEAALAQYNPRHASRARYLGAALAYDSAVKFKQKDDYLTSSRLAKRAVRDCPHCPHSPDAQLIYGRSLMAQNELDQAVKELKKVELNYPDSSEVGAARKLLAELGGGPPPTPEKSKKPEPVQSVQADPPPPVQAAPPKSSGRQSPPGSAESGPAQVAAQSEAKAAPKTVPPAAPKNSGKAKAAPPKALPAPAARPDGRAQVYGLALSDEGGHSTVIAYVDKVTPYVYNLIPPSRNGGSFRVYADLKGAVIAPKTKLQLPSGDNKLIKLVKMNQFKEDVVRVVMDMPEAHHYRPTFLDNPPRLVFQVARDASSLPAQVAEAQPAPPEEKNVKPAPKTPAPEKARPVKGPDESLARQLGLKVKTVVIDPGHGGKDVGASGRGLKEKEIVLSLSRKLAARVEKRLKVKVELTRDEDRFITLERRTKIAKDKKADLFISLHVNANDLAEVEGFETYVLNFATDRSAMAVAARENAESDKSVAELQDLLSIIAKNTKIAESRAMAQTLHKSAVSNINKKFKVRDLGVKEAPFWVLVGTEVPSILVEIGFITNEKDAARLSQEAYLDAVADGLAQGLENYVKGF